MNKRGRKKGGKYKGFKKKEQNIIGGPLRASSTSYGTFSCINCGHVINITNRHFLAILSHKREL